MKRITKSIKELVEIALTAKTNEPVICEIGKPSKKVVDAVKQLTGLDIDGYTHVIDIFAIRHTIFKHGNAAKEAKRGQIAVTLDYIEKASKVVLSPDEIIDGGCNDIGRRVLIYQKRINNNVFYLEEIRTKKKELAMQTMYIKRVRQ